MLYKYSEHSIYAYVRYVPVSDTALYEVTSDHTLYENHEHNEQYPLLLVWLIYQRQFNDHDGQIH